MAEISGALKDVDGAYSSKRVLAFIALALYGAGFIADTFTAHKVSPALADGLMVIILAGMGTALAERFASKPSPEPKP